MQRSNVDRVEAKAPLIPFAGFGSCSAPQCQVIRSRLRYDPCRRGQADKWKAPAIGKKDDRFKGCFAVGSSPQAGFSTSIADPLSSAEAVAGKGRQRQEVQERRGRAKRCFGML